MEYDWPGIERGNNVYCCAACANGQPCTCPAHLHDYATDGTISTVQTIPAGTSVVEL
jgi:hypothetical protein